MFQLVAKERMGNADPNSWDEGIRDWYILWHAHLPYEHVISMQKMSFWSQQQGEVQR